MTPKLMPRISRITPGSSLIPEEDKEGRELDALDYAKKLLDCLYNTYAMRCCAVHLYI